MRIQWNKDREIADLIRRALKEDGVREDETTLRTISATARSRALIVARENSVAAGLPLVKRIYQFLDPGVKVSLEFKDGECFPKQAILAVIEGSSRSLLSGERLVLNFLQRLCAIAGLTSRYVAVIRGTGAEILDTRKTTPGLRRLEKYAVICGGGTNHRYNLSDGILIKDNHIQACGSVQQAVTAARRSKRKKLPVQVEVEDLVQLKQAIAAGADGVLLDNMEPALMKKAVQMCPTGMFTEASGGIGLNNVRRVALSGVHRISIGALTHSAVSVDLSMEFQGL